VVLGVLGDAGDNAVIAEAKKRFQSYKSDKSSVSNDLMGVIFKLAVRNGGKAEYDEMVHFFKSATQPEEVIRALRSVGLSKDPQLIQSAIEFAFSDAVRTQDMFYLLHSCSSTVVGRELTWKHIKAHWETLLSKLSGGNFLLGRIVAYATQSFTGTAKADEVDEFFKTRTLPAIERTVSQSLESIRGNAQYLEKNLAETTAWLKQHF